METRLVLIVHGSRDPAWRAPIEALVRAVATRVGEERLRLAYMDYAAPSLLEVAAEAARDGVARLKVLPLFISGGGHVEHDIPALVTAAGAAQPGLLLELLESLGEHDEFVDLVGELAGVYLESEIGP